MIPAHRLQLADVAPRNYGAMYRFSQATTLDPALKDLIEIRASQINGCAFCLDMHHKDARARGETDERLYMVAAWREARCYDERERAALALTEAVTLVSETGVPDAVWDEAEAQFDADELAQLVFSITVINAWNRLMITSRAEPGHYEPGMFG
ncbi:MAG TPA: carboxymuconolactone decarboxylase family protein [Solirubrobacter sp.]|nr:carboxymuconolactone decarboxylase family protein [Solirubrobacter sp.]